MHTSSPSSVTITKPFFRDDESSNSAIAARKESPATVRRTSRKSPSRITRNSKNTSRSNSNTNLVQLGSMPETVDPKRSKSTPASPTSRGKTTNNKTILQKSVGKPLQIKTGGHSDSEEVSMHVMKTSDNDPSAVPLVVPDAYKFNSRPSSLPSSVGTSACTSPVQTSGKSAALLSASPESPDRREGSDEVSYALRNMGRYPSATELYSTLLLSVSLSLYLYSISITGHLVYILLLL